jgi:2-keto-myo-inositol isomerase
MIGQQIDRRSALQLLGAAAGMVLLPRIVQASPATIRKTQFLYCMNTATLRGQKLGLIKELEIVSKAGFEGVEIWMDTLEAYLHNGGTVKELNNRISDLGVTIENAIGFEKWIVEDETLREKGIGQLRKQMDLLASIGCRRIAAPPSGATDGLVLDLKKVAARYRTILELGDQTGVVPQLELWGFSANLSRLSDVLYVAVESGHPKAKLLLDNYHLYKGGTSMSSLHLLSPGATDIFHVNDYPNIPPADITDADRVMPGDGISPLKRILQILNDPSRRLLLSVEIFNKNYYSQDATKVAELALRKIKTVAEG